MNESDHFAKLVLSKVASAEPFIPQAWYNKDGDSLEFLAKPDSYYAERVDDVVTVLYSHDTNEIIGSIIKGVSKFTRQITKKCPGFVISIKHGRVQLAHLFLARLWTMKVVGPGDLRILTYEKLAEVAEATGLEAELTLQDA